MKMLLVEDERRASEYLRQGLTENGLAVELAHNGVEDSHAALSGDRDLIVLDVMMPSGVRSDADRQPPQRFNLYTFNPI